jgi:hypothetical protein
MVVNAPEKLSFQRRLESRGGEGLWILAFARMTNKSGQPGFRSTYKREGLLYAKNSNHYYITVYELLPFCVMML